ncbi:hypothetical protein [Actinoallomurus sp. CA-150999]|uniref:hypothetical protein n=1 Tax=Actinoallomurus sp. CA-150999 TaxID=3239887 RepID=UPI003D918F11
MDDALTLLGRAEHLRVLTGVTDSRLAAGHPLDDPSHVLLRELARADGLEAVRAYLDRPARRGAALAHVVSRLKDIDYGPLSEHDIDPAAVCTIPGAAREAALGLLSGTATGRVDGDGVRWANRHSFGVLHRDTVAWHAGHPFTMVTERAASVFARRYYGFTVGDRFFAQPASVQVVAAGYDWLARLSRPAPGLTPWQRYGVALLRDIPADGGRERQVLDMYATHEVAHTYRLDGQAPLEETLARTGHDPRDAFRHGIPGPHHLGAWDRLAAGGGTPARNTFDVTFLLSDVLATLTQALVRTGTTVNRLQRAYLWQAVTPPTPRSARRGVISCLRAAELLDVPGLFADLEKILTAARTAPETVSRLLIALEERSLRHLRDRFPQAAPVGEGPPVG